MVLNTIEAQDLVLAHDRFSFNELTVDDGLSQNSVISIAQDTTGFLWFATQDGLNRYDGREFQIVNEQFEDVTRPSYSKLGKVYIDHENNFWAITNPGTLKFYDRNKGQFHSIKSIDSASVITQDLDKNIYIGTYGKGLFKINNTNRDTIQVLNKSNSILRIYDLLEWQDHIWIAGSGGVYSYEPKNNRLDTILKVSNINFSSLAQKKNNIYVGSYQKGLFIASAQEKKLKLFKGFSQEKFPTSIVILDLMMDSYDRLWVATYGQGLYIIDFPSEKIKHFTADKNNPHTINYNDILSLFQDSSGTIWLGSDGAGLSYYDEYLSKFNSLTNEQLPLNINVDIIRSIAKENNNVWLGTSGKGLTRINLKTLKGTTIKPGASNLKGNRIMSLLYDGQTLWIGHQEHGLQKMDSNGIITDIKEIDNLTIWKILKASESQLWLCTRNHGLIRYDKEKGILAHYNSKNSSLNADNIRTIEPGNSNSYWIGTELNGLFLLDTETDKIKQIKSIPDKIKSLYYDGKTLWIGTNGNGLKCYDPTTGNTLHFTTQNGLANNVIYGILPDGENNLWLSSNKGITKFSHKKGRASIENYGNYNGLQSYEFNTGAYFRDKEGTLYFGGLEGLNWFKPEQIHFNPFKPNTVITQVKVFDDVRSLSDVIPLKHVQNTIAFNFASLQFSQPKLNKYKYRLQGLDEDWIFSGNKNEVRYTNLSPGKYKFEVLSSNYDGVWGESPAAYDFEIEQPWHITNMAVAVFTSFVFQGCFIAIGLFMLLLYLRLHRRDYLLYGTYILLFATYFFLRIDLELQTGIFTNNRNLFYYILTPTLLLVTGIFIQFVSSFADIKSYSPKFSRELYWFSIVVYIIAALSLLYLLTTQDFGLVKDRLNLFLLPLHIFSIYAVIKAYIIVKSTLRYYIILGNFFLIAFTMVGVYFGSKNAFSGGAEANNVFGFYSFNISQMGVFLELIVFSMGLGHKFYSVEMEKNKMQKIDELKTKLFTDISHEIRTPLSLVSGPLENQLNRKNLTEKDIKELTMAKNNTDRLTELFSQMTDLSLLDSGQRTFKLTQGNLNSQLVQLSETFQYKANSKKMTLRTTIQGLHNCWFDKDMIEKIVSNLLSNAIKYAPENSSVLLDAKEKDNALLLTVVNVTKGSSNMDLSKIFKRFYQDNDTSEGIGVGLALVKELVELAQGTVTVGTIENNQIQFSVNLPVNQR
ncbi:sensor histidine kinase [Maribacter cobaltidurans]|uniref:histidine kinase n=1 Tax=Maribacter cobaltidurans TaxID=1178778 RepID=A0A223V4G9_9FLAO|nr:two-component regulator propeller domain-containing protein [Maribacter cobaltidurans]ASV29739.1 hypothetical protein CJ263_05625 [Maribacter cobaltidurans]GGD92982.1 hypothetical protein GCM10011412_33660 [Maribacter cobaltidurans]